MKPPPTVASWLLRHLAFGPDDALAGDLVEQFQQGRSSLWYWRQVLWTILARALADARVNKRVTIRAAIVSVIIVIVWAYTTRALYLWMSHNWVNAWTKDSRLLLVYWHYYGGHPHLCGASGLC